MFCKMKNVVSMSLNPNYSWIMNNHNKLSIKLGENHFNLNFILTYNICT